MKSSFYISSLILLTVVFSLSFISAEEFGYNYLTDEDTLRNLNDVNITSPLELQLLLYNQSSNKWYNSFLNDSVHSVNASDYWITDIGSLSTVNATQFSNQGGTLNIIEGWIDSLWCRLTGCTMSGDIDMGGNDIINVNLIEDYNKTENLTIFYDARYLTGELALYFYNGTSPINSSYTIMNTTIPTGGEQRDSFENLVNGDNLLTKRILSGLNITILERGAYNQHTTIDYISGTKDVSMRSELYILYENGTENIIGSSPPSIGLINGAFQQIIWTGVIDNDIIFPEGSHLTMYLYVTVSGSGQAPNIDLVVGGGTAARLDIGINPTDIKTIEVDPFAFYKDGSTTMQGNANIGGFNITNVNNITAEVVSWGGGWITSNATCSYLRYNLTGTLKESECP